MAEILQRVRKVMDELDGLHVLATVDEEQRPQMRWMGALVEDPDQPWTFYLACGKDSRKMHQIATNNHAQLLFTNVSEWQVAALSGTAESVDTPEIRALLWEKIPVMEKYYSDVNDPQMGIIKFTTRCMKLLCMHESHEPYCFEME